MIKQFLKIAGVKNEKEFLAKYPTEASFFRAHPEARQLVKNTNSSSGFVPSYGEAAMPQAMYGIGMAYGGSYDEGGQPNICYDKNGNIIPCPYKPLSDNELSALAHQLRGMGENYGTYQIGYDFPNNTGRLTSRERAQLKKYMDSRSGLGSFWEALPNWLGQSGSSGIPKNSRLKDMQRTYFPNTRQGWENDKEYWEAQGYAYGGALPKAQVGLQAPPSQKDYPDYETWAQATDDYLMSLQQQANASQTLPQGQVAAASPAQQVSASKFELNPYKGVSIVDFLRAQGKPSDFASRKQLASALGITNYRGTAKQNSDMLALLQSAPAALASYQGTTQPTGGVRKASATSINNQTAPTTEELANARLQSVNANSEAVRQAQAEAAASQLAKNLAIASAYTDAINQNPFNEQPSFQTARIRRDITTGRWVHVPDPAGMMTVENARRMKLADQMNAAEAAKASGQPVIGPARGYAEGGSYPWNGTWNGNQGFQVGGSYVPDYASSAYGLPQFELGSPIMQAGGPAPTQGADQQKVMQVIYQMLQQGAAPQQILQQLVQAGVPQEMAVQLFQVVSQQLGGGQPNGVQQQSVPGDSQQGMEGEPMPNGMAYGGFVPGWEGEVTEKQLAALRKKGVKFDII